MRRYLLSALIAVLSAAPTASGQTVSLDRIAVSVGSQVITESALALDLRLTAFRNRKAMDTSPTAKREAAEILVDQILIAREASQSRLDLPVPDRAALLKQIVALYPSEAQYRADLLRYQITEDELAEYLQASARVLVFADLRFRSAAQVSEDTVRARYQELAAANPAGQAFPSFDDSRRELEDLLNRQKSLEAMDVWLKMVRSASRIDYRKSVFADASAPPGGSR